MSPTELSDVLLRSSGGVTQILDRLERVGLVERSNDLDDRRKVLVGLTPNGVRLARQAGAAYKAERDRMLEGLSDAEVRRIDSAVTRLLELLTAESSES
jgi:DNA-binding MarR family transcriptional regulator